MSPEDESELHRLTGMLSGIDATLPEASPLREALQKAGLAITFAFVDGRRSEIEKAYESLDAQLTNEQHKHLRSMGVDPDSDRGD